MASSAAQAPERRANSSGRALSWKKRSMRWVVLILALYGGWLLLLYFNQDMLLYPGAGAPLAEAGPPPTGVESLWIEPEPGVRVEAWFVPGRGCSADSPGPA